MKKFIFTFVLMLTALSASAQYRVDRLVTAGRSALYYEDFVLSIKYFNLAIGAKPYLSMSLGITAVLPNSISMITWVLRAMPLRR